MDRLITSVVGQTGSGKTTLIKERVLPDLPEPVFILDPMHEYSAGRDGILYTGDLEGCQRNPAREFVRLVQTGNSKVLQAGRHVFRPRKMDPDISDVQEVLTGQAEDILGVLDRAGQSGTIVIDETDLFSNATRALDPIENMVMRGRHASQNLVFSYRRPSRVSKSITSESHVAVCFHLRENDAVRFRDLGEADRITSLGQYEYVALGAVDRAPYSQNLEPATVG